MNASFPLVASVLIATAGCSVMKYGGAPAPIPGTAGTPGFDGGSAMPTTRSKATQSGSRQICRNASVPRGWIAVDYVAAPGSCPPLDGKRELGANAALIVQYETVPIETILVVCSDQHIPSSWMREPEEDGDALSTQCPRRPGDTRTGPTILRIRRRP